MHFARRTETGGSAEILLRRAGDAMARCYLVRQVGARLSTNVRVLSLGSARDARRWTMAYREIVEFPIYRRLLPGNVNSVCPLFDILAPILSIRDVVS